MEVRVRNNNVEKAVKILKKKLQKEGLFRELRIREFYEKPSEKKRRRNKDSKNRVAKELRDKLKKER
ncbi:MAG: 30S ribosomal protein S21 [Euryarchaeota archaeon]|jgi:small subunit ribosomal protein S21|nr:30S ribosomal protein S21 [Euryarchaeota archaeon]|tara:strand:- start:987 stop:1187 length:201 start_codon:yes stop_codon:yes gene_type:complete